MKTIALLALPLLVSFCAGPVSAEMLLDTGPGPATPIGYGVYGPNSPYGSATGSRFSSLAGEFTIDDVWTINSVQGWMAALRR